MMAPRPATRIGKHAGAADRTSFAEHLEFTGKARNANIGPDATLEVSAFRSRVSRHEALREGSNTPAQTSAQIAPVL
jgi:hypothetical protein